MPNPRTVTASADSLRDAYREASRLGLALRLFSVDGVRLKGGPRMADAGLIVEHVMADLQPLPAMPDDPDTNVVVATVWGARGQMFSLNLNQDTEVMYRAD